MIRITGYSISNLGLSPKINKILKIKTQSDKLKFKNEFKNEYMGLRSNFYIFICIFDF